MKEVSRNKNFFLKKVIIGGRVQKRKRTKKIHAQERMNFDNKTRIIIILDMCLKKKHQSAFGRVWIFKNYRGDDARGSQY